MTDITPPPNVGEDRTPVKNALLRHKIIFRAQIMIAIAIILYLSTAFFQNHYAFDRAKSVDFLNKTDSVLMDCAKITGLSEAKLLDTTRTAMAHKLAPNGYQSVVVDRFMKEGKISPGNLREVISKIAGLKDTVSLSQAGLLDKINKFADNKLDVFQLNQFIDGAGFWTPLVSFLFAVLLTDILLLIVTGYRMSLERDRADRLLAQRNASDNPKDIRLSWVSAQTTLDIYYRRNLAQNTWTFVFSVMVIIMGFILIFWGIGKAVSNPAPDKNSGLVATLSTVSGIITQLVGGTFLAIYNSTLKQALDYTNNLQRTSTVGTSLAILNSIELEGNAAANDATTIAGRLIDAKIEIAKQLIAQPVG